MKLKITSTKNPKLVKVHVYIGKQESILSAMTRDVRTEGFEGRQHIDDGQIYIEHAFTEFP